jgi:predicted AAA+ superfamily ATPase
MDANTLRSIVAEWSYWESDPPKSQQRQVSLPSKLHADLVFIIQGVRRCGKSTLLSQLPKFYKLPLKNCFFLNFEDPRLLNDLNHTLLSKLVDVAREKIKATEACYFFLDEIQNVEGFEKWLHVQLERPKKNYFVVTGSNSCLLSGEFSTTLTGRHISLDLYPFSLKEYLTLFPKRKLRDYLLTGGFPRPLTFENPQQLLQEYFNDIILRDVLKRVHARSPDTVKIVAKMAFESSGSELSFRKIAAVTGISVDTVKSYLSACEQAFLLFSCPFFAFSEKQRLSRQKKYYAIDAGLRRSVVSVSGQDLGKSLETQVFLSLKKRYGQVFYWQELHLGEVDFVVLDGSDILPFQITLGETKARHEIALEHFYKQFPKACEAVMINETNASQFL